MTKILLDIIRDKSGKVGVGEETNRHYYPKIQHQIEPTRTNCDHQYEVGSPIDTVEVCIKCGDMKPCAPLIDNYPK